MVTGGIRFSREPLTLCLVDRVNPALIKDINSADRSENAKIAHNTFTRTVLSSLFLLKSPY